MIIVYSILAVHDADDDANVANGRCEWWKLACFT